MSKLAAAARAAHAVLWQMDHGGTHADAYRRFNVPSSTYRVLKARYLADRDALAAVAAKDPDTQPNLLQAPAPTPAPASAPASAQPKAAATAGLAVSPPDASKRNSVLGDLYVAIHRASMAATGKPALARHIRSLLLGEAWVIERREGLDR